MCEEGGREGGREGGGAMGILMPLRGLRCSIYNYCYSTVDNEDLSTNTTFIAPPISVILLLFVCLIVGFVE